MTHLYVVTFNNAQRRNLLSLAARDEISIEHWVERAAMSEAQRRMAPVPKIPRHELVARKRPTFRTPALAPCVHCLIPTRPVKTCDNCDKELP